MIVLGLNEQGQSSLKLELYVFTLRLVVWNGYLLAQLLARLLAEPRQRQQLPIFGKIRAFSAISAPIIASQYAFCNIFQNRPNYM